MGSQHAYQTWTILISAALLQAFSDTTILQTRVESHNRAQINGTVLVAVLDGQMLFISYCICNKTHPLRT